MTRSGEALTVLVVNDDGETLLMPRRSFRARGCRTLIAEDCAEAAEHAEAERLDLLYTDLQFRALDRLVEQARAHPRLRGVPVVTVDMDYADRRFDHITVFGDYGQLERLMESIRMTKRGTQPSTTAA